MMGAMEQSAAIHTLAMAKVLCLKKPARLGLLLARSETTLDVITALQELGGGVELESLTMV